MNEEKKDLKTEVVNQKSDNNKNIGDIFRKLIENKMMRYFIILIVLLFIFLIFMFLISIIFPKKASYGKIEQTMEDAARKYFNDHKSKLPQEEMASVSISAERLAELRYMKELKSYLPKETECSGSVTVTKNTSTTHNYIGYLDCGKEYITTEFYKKITDSKNIVNTGYGLYNINNEFVFRGEIKNNYVKMDEHLFRIVKVNSNNEIVLILNTPFNEKEDWDDRFNSSVDWEAGINDYSVSRVREFLNEKYVSGDKYTLNLSKESKEKLVKFNTCIGKRSEEDASKNGSAECGKMLENQIISLLPAYDYMNASVDSGCVKTNSKTCENYNYLAEVDRWWLLTASNKNNYEVYNINAGRISLAKASSYKKIRPVIHLSSTAKYDSGNGTEANPYIFR